MHSNLNTVGNRLGSRPGSPAVLVWAAWIAISFVLALHASQRGLKSDYDAVGYAAWFNIVSSFSVGSFLSALQESNLYFQGDLFFSFEVGFAILTFLISRVVDGTEGFFFAVAFISLVLKAYAIERTCARPQWAFAWYLTWYYLLLEMTTMRAGLAAAVVLVGIRWLMADKPWRFFIAVALAMTFHLSSAIALVLIPLWRSPLGPRMLLAFLGASFVVSMFSILPLIEWAGQFNAKIAEYYQIYTLVGFYESLNRFNAVVLLRILLLLMGLAAGWRIYRQDRSFAFAANVYAASIIFYYALSSFPLLGGRIYEFLGVFQVLFISHYVRHFGRRVFWMGPLVLTLVVQFYVLVFHVKFVDFFYFFGDSYAIESEHRR